MSRLGAWAEGPLLPPGWRPDREEPRDDTDDHRWMVADLDGRVRLADGTEVLLRPLRPGDGPLLSAGFERLSPRSRYRRFFAPVPRLTSSMLDFLTSVDESNHRAWGALVTEPSGVVGAGIVRWVRSRKDPGVADVAVTVIDDYQGRGLGGLLWDVAVLDASACGVERFEGVVLGENIASRRMLARGGATLRPDGGGVLAFRLELADRAGRPGSAPLAAILGRLGARPELTA